LLGSVWFHFASNDYLLRTDLLDKNKAAEYRAEKCLQHEEP
jgi:hypothetical protein